MGHIHRDWKRKVGKHPAATYRQVNLICKLWKEKYSPSIACQLSAGEASQLISALLPLVHAQHDEYYGWSAVPELQEKVDAVQKKIEEG